MPIISAIFATAMLICAFELLGKELFNFGSMELKTQIYVIFVLAYLLIR
jgi:hypothetical protein